MFGLCVKLAETMLQLVVLVVVVTVGPGCEQLVRFIVLVVGFSRAWRVLCTSIVYLGLSTVLVRSVNLVAIVIANIAVLWKSLIFQSILLQLAFLIVFSVACTAFFAISLICVVICFTIAIIRMIIVISVCRGSVMFGLLSFWNSCIDCLCYVPS